MANDIDFKSLNELLGSVNMDNITADSGDGFENVPDGYYLCELESAELTTSKTSGAPQVAIRFKIIEDGLGTFIDERGYAKMKDIPHTANRKLFKYYPLTSEQNVNRFVSDMLKFEGMTAGESILPKEAFTTAEVLEDALGILTGCRLYVQVSTTTNKTTGQASTWNNLVSWKRAKSLELPD